METNTAVLRGSNEYYCREHASSLEGLYLGLFVAVYHSLELSSPNRIVISCLTEDALDRSIAKLLPLERETLFRHGQIKKTI